VDERGERYRLKYAIVAQKHSYRKQIARQQRTQYVEGIYDNP